MDDVVFHAVKLGAHQAVLASYGLTKTADTTDGLDHYRAMVKAPLGQQRAPAVEAGLDHYRYMMRSPLVQKQDPGLLKRLFSYNYKPNQTIGATLLDSGRHMVFGSPVTAYRQINMLRNAPTANGGKAGLPRALAEFGRRFYWRRPNTKTLGGAINLALQVHNLGGIGYDLYHAAKQEDPNLRNGDLASAAAGLIAAPITSQFGLLGNAAHSAITQGARKLVQKDAPPYTPALNPIEYGSRALRGLRVQDDLSVPELTT